ncbi:hypothetical protein [Haloarchaeobius sp. DT45]|uniref:hypothetical protein n=1 Tax=Haloarchaeobius sp. DT45 TaxID=3446116 RepID=UPI003F6D8879
MGSKNNETQFIWAILALILSYSLVEYRPLFFVEILESLRWGVAAIFTGLAIYVGEKFVLNTDDSFAVAFDKMLKKQEFLVVSAAVIIIGATVSGHFLKIIVEILRDERYLISALGATFPALWFYIHGQIPNWNSSSFTGQSLALILFGTGLMIFPWVV